MKKLHSVSLAFLFLFTLPSISQTALKIDLHNAVKNKSIDVINRQLTLIDDPAHPGIRLSKDIGEGIAWLKGIDFSNGILEFDVRGENVKQHSFVGIAFHGSNNYTFDAIYLRPFQFKEPDDILRSRSVQYISMPDYTWKKLRETSPGKYEHAIDPTPDPDSWIRMRIVIKDGTVSAYINGNKEASLVVRKVTESNSGSIGFYVADTSGGDFANITVTKTD